jgi:hypothetical protein
LGCDLVALAEPGDDLLGGGVQSLRRSLTLGLSEFLDDGGTKTRREWTDHHGRRREAELTDVAWWFQMFALLRNKTAHGGALVDEDFIFEGAPHVWHAEWTLRRVLKQILVNRGHGDVVLDEFDRIIKKHIPSED